MALGLVALWGCQRTPPTVHLEAQLQGDGSATLTVTGRAGIEVAVVATRPWQGDEALYAGLVGARGSSLASAADVAAGVGTQAAGVLGDGPFVTSLAPQRLAALPAPLVFQVVAGERRDGATWVTVSNAWRLARADGRATIVPFTAGHGLADAAGPLLWFVLVPLAAAGLLLRLLRGRRPPRWGVPAFVVAAVAVRLLDGDATWPWQVWPAADELTQLERHYGTGLQQVVATVQQARSGDEPVVVLVDAARIAEHQSLAAQLVRRFPGAAVAGKPDELPARGLVVVLATTRVAPPIDRPPPAPHQPSGRQLLATPVAVVWRVGGD